VFVPPTLYEFIFFVCVAVDHNVEDDFGMACGTKMAGHGGADFFAIDAFVHAVSVCIIILKCVVVMHFLLLQDK